MRMLISAHKEELLKEIKHQLSLGPESLAEEDKFLLECNFDNIVTTNVEHQEYWLLERRHAFTRKQRLHSNSNAVSIPCRDRHRSDIGTNYNKVYAQSHASALNNSLEVNTPGRRELSLRGPDCNTALKLLLVAYEDSILLILSR
jgi:hypothetical protein